jgi:hypothetical protein
MLIWLEYLTSTWIRVDESIVKSRHRGFPWAAGACGVSGGLMYLHGRSDFGRSARAPHGCTGLLAAGKESGVFTEMQPPGLSTHRLQLMPILQPNLNW